MGRVRDNILGSLAVEENGEGGVRYVRVHYRTYTYVLARTQYKITMAMVQEDPWIDESIHGSTERSAPRAEEQSQNKRMHNVVAAVSLSP